MHLILTGATGLVGSGVLDAMLHNTGITKISILSRRPVPMAEGHSKAQVITHTDFNNYPSSLLSQLQGAHGVVWALGISQNAVSKDDYVKITRDYTLAAARAFATLNDEFNFVYVSGEGATQKPAVWSPLFGRVKGETETALIEYAKEVKGAKPGFNVFNLRPGAVEWLEHPAIHPYIPTPPWYVKALLPAFRALAPKSQMSPTMELGKVLTELAMGDGKALTGDGIEGEEGLSGIVHSDAWLGFNRGEDVYEKGGYDE